MDDTQENKAEKIPPRNNKHISTVEPLMHNAFVFLVPLDSFILRRVVQGTSKRGFVSKDGTRNGMKHIEDQTCNDQMKDLIKKEYSTYYGPDGRSDTSSNGAEKSISERKIFPFSIRSFWQICTTQN